MDSCEKAKDCEDQIQSGMNEEFYGGKSLLCLEPDDHGQVTIEKFKKWWSGVQQGQLVPTNDSSPASEPATEPASPSPEMLAMQAELEAARETIAALEVSAAAATIFLLRTTTGVSARPTTPGFSIHALLGNKQNISDIPSTDS